jgi:ABC-type nitrate/sulfonate/bicarbonate transport system permease component
MATGAPSAPGRGALGARETRVTPGSRPANHRREFLSAGQGAVANRGRLAAISLATVIIVWAAVTNFGWVNHALVPTPQEVGRAAAAAIADGSLWRNTVASLTRVIEGFAVAMLIAVPLGAAMGISGRLRGLVEPLIELLRPVPPIAFIPLAILWFGIEEASKVMIIAYGAFFPIFVNTMAGFRDVDRVHVRAAQTLGAHRLHLFRDVVLPSAFPQIVTGARLGMGMAFIVLVAAELVASSEGLGFLINDARFSFRTDQIFVGIITIGILGFALNAGLLVTERRLLRWRAD